MDIEAHLKQAHKTTLKIYSANFENPDCKDNPKEIVAKLVRMGVLEEPSDKCRTPKKLKMRVSELKYKTTDKKDKEIEPRKCAESNMAKIINPVPVTVKNNAPLLANSSVALSSPIRKMKIPKIKSEVPEVKTEQFYPFIKWAF